MFYEVILSYHAYRASGHTVIYIYDIDIFNHIRKIPIMEF